MKILVTGACGFVGSTLIRAWVERGHPRRSSASTTSSAPAASGTAPRLRALGVTVHHADIRLASDFEALPAVDVVVDAAANPSVLAGVDGQTSSRQLVEHNLIGTVNVLEYCRASPGGAGHAEHEPGVLDSRRSPRCRFASSNDAFEPDPAAPLPAGLTRAGRRRDVFHGAARLALRRDQARERAAGARVRRRRSAFPCGSTAAACSPAPASSAAPTRASSPTGSTAGCASGRCATSASAARATRCATACTRRISFR